MATTPASKPTRRQLAYLKSLADRTGQTFTYPQTGRQARAEINRLTHTKPSSRTERSVERKLIADQIAAGPIDAARVRDDEIHGHGSTATWTQNHERQPSTPPRRDTRSKATPRRPIVGERTELGAYTIDGKRRLIIGQRIDGVVRVCDYPEGQGRAYLIERALTNKAELDALVADYLLCRTRHTR
jgi:hypothetical protein